MVIDVASLYPADTRGAAKRALTPVASELIGSRILGVAAQVRQLQEQGRTICDLTVGDFNPKHFPAPLALREKIAELTLAGQTNYPPADGLPVLRKAIVDLYERRLGLKFPMDAVVVASGARPPLYAALECLLAPGDEYIYGLPTWNNEYYVHLTQAKAVTLPTTAEDNFLLTAAQIAPHIRTARVVHLNSPLNPCGTCISADALRDIAQLIVDENRRREAAGERSVFLLYDMVYWLLTFGDVQHVDPIVLVPEIAPYVIYIDAISKWFAATGLRVGWGVMPAYLQPKLKALIGHMGAWAPRPEQMATAWLMSQDEAVDVYLDELRGALKGRLDLIHQRMAELKAEGLPVDAVSPQGALYLSVQINLIGRTLPNGTVVSTNEQIREYILFEAGVAAVPFRAFGLEEESGWFRMSVGAVGLDELALALERLAGALRKVR